MRGRAEFADPNSSSPIYSEGKFIFFSRYGKSGVATFRTRYTAHRDTFRNEESFQWRDAAGNLRNYKKQR